MWGKKNVRNGDEERWIKIGAWYVESGKARKEGRGVGWLYSGAPE